MPIGKFMSTVLWSPWWTSSTLSRHFEQITLSSDWSQTIHKDLPGTKICLTRSSCWGETTNVPAPLYFIIIFSSLFIIVIFLLFYFLVEVKLQTFPHLYRGTFHCFTNTWRTEGVASTIILYKNFMKIILVHPLLISSLFILFTSFPNIILVHSHLITHHSPHVKDSGGVLLKHLILEIIIIVMTSIIEN